MSEKTIAFFADGGFLAHVTRTFEVGRALHKLYGHRVVFCGTGSYMHIPRDAGFEVVPVYTVDRNITMKLAERAGLCSLSWWRDECDKSVRSDLEVIDYLKPDLVVGDMHWSLCTSARVAQVPYVAITNAAWTRWYTEELEPPSGHFSTRFLGDKLARKVFPVLKDALTNYYALGYTNVRKRYHLPPVHTIYDLIEGDLTILADIKEFMPIVKGAPPSFRYAGPVLWHADMKAPEWLKTLDPERPTLYFTMGSTGDTQFFHEAIRVFGNTEYQVLITTGGLVDLGSVPKNVFVEKYSPGVDLMRASDVVVSHGGNGTVYQALSCGVPIIGFPSIFDQEMNMQRVCALGAGVRMWRSQYDATALKRAVEGVISDPAITKRCKKIARRIAYMDGRRRAALHIHHLLQSGNPTTVPTEVTTAMRGMPDVEGGSPRMPTSGYDDDPEATYHG
ncbi:MAG: glycosyltransferase [Polyangiaceae bacterium]